MELWASVGLGQIFLIYWMGLVVHTFYLHYLTHILYFLTDGRLIGGICHSYSFTLSLSHFFLGRRREIMCNV
ncbi:hypothetical protein POJ06DRAFT_116392 [Lipomyces tetrasporus]|uniref:Uncharacterized protein n=1 Tax=Lipomyces tetrasporus TaxID=54092 RepID=A0AAD7QQV1_9ASCO|nr:uncharacterized protein POJ06DRAFT_116392 [Lipomyces tetrasporus]KAJ8099763.1 hypothetical protein POJ06DRAFT_116392 [Lipomyces tetrasporus]